jgi:HNH endonuclease
MAYAARTELQRFEAMFVVETDGCWQWVAGCYRNGYGAFQRRVDETLSWKAPGNKKNHLAHRVAYEFYVGPIPEGLDIDHLCRNRSCVNPDHMEPVTRQENLRRGRGYGGELRTHCSRGHELTDENLIVEQFGYRRCKTCRSLNKREV